MVGKNFTDVGFGFVANEYTHYLPSYGDSSRSSINKRGASGRTTDLVYNLKMMTCWVMLQVSGVQKCAMLDGEGHHK